MIRRCNLSKRPKVDFDHDNSFDAVLRQVKEVIDLKSFVESNTKQLLSEDLSLKQELCEIKRLLSSVLPVCAIPYVQNEETNLVYYANKLKSDYTPKVSFIFGLFSEQCH